MKTLLSVGRRFPNNPRRTEIVKALRDAGWVEREPSPAAPSTKFTEFHKGEDHAYVYENEVLFGSDGVGKWPAGYRGFGDVLAILLAN